MIEDFINKRLIYELIKDDKVLYHYIELKENKDILELIKDKNNIIKKKYVSEDFYQEIVDNNGFFKYTNWYLINKL